MAAQEPCFQMEYCFVLTVIPGSDSGEAEQTIIFEHLRFSLIRGFVPASCPEGTTMWHKNHLQESRAFWILFGGQKVS